MNSNIGTLKNNKREVRGMMYYNSGDKYEGDYKNDQRDGKGVYISDGYKYKGDFKKGLREGKGVIIYKTGDKYDGEWFDDMYNGKGVYYFKDGSKYDGNWKNNQPNGYGVFEYTNGEKYEGDFKNNIREGYGKYFYENGNRYEGQYVDDKQEGVGTMFFNIGDIGGHLWFLRALVYVYFIYAILIKIKKVDYVLYILPIIYVIDLIVCKYSLVIFNDSLPIYVYEPITKFFGTGFLSFSLGFFIKNDINKRLKNTILFLLILNIIEFMLLNYHSKDVILCNYIFTIPLAYFVFAYFLQLRDIGSDNIFARIGKNNSTDIYVYHILILEVFNALFASYFNIYMYFRAFLIFFVTLIISMILNNFRKIRR